MADSSLKRRRGLGIITPLACTECRKKRCKCDGQLPCGRCLVHETECLYEAPVKRSKEDMRREIGTLRAHQSKTLRVLHALCLDDDDAHRTRHQLRGGVSIDAIVSALDARDPGAGKAPESDDRERATSVTSTSAFDPFPADASADPAAWTLTSSSSTLPWSPMMSIHHDYSPYASMSHLPATLTITPVPAAVRCARKHGQSIILGSQSHPDPPRSSLVWTSLTTDRDMIEHLLALYFCWEYPAFATLSKDHFWADYCTGKIDHCSPLLVNAILCLGCRFSDDLAVRADPHEGNTAGAQFYDEAKRLFALQTDRHVVTTIQALSLMSLYQASHGSTSAGLYYAGQAVRLATEMGLHRQDYSRTPPPPEGSGHHGHLDETVRTATFWGAYSLNQAWSLCVGSLPQCSRTIQDVARPPVDVSAEHSIWIPYTDQGAPPSHATMQPSNLRSVYVKFCELSTLMHQAAYVLYDPTAPVTSRTLLECYHRYLCWYASIPATMRLGQSATPTVLFIHMQYHCAILLLFRPFIKMALTHSAVSPRDVCTQAAHAILALVQSYDHLFTLRRTPCFVPFTLLTACITLLHNVAQRAPPDAADDADPMRQLFHSLTPVTAAHGFAHRAQDIVQYFVKAWQMDLDLPVDHHPPGELSLAQLERRCRPRTGSMNLFCAVRSKPDETRDDDDAPSRIERPSVHTPAPAPAPTGSDGDPLFCVFPFQGRPLLPTSPIELENAGFRVLDG